MFEQAEAAGTGDFFVPLSSRRRREVYFCRVNGYNGAIARFISDYYDAALKNGVVVEGKIGNPTPENLEYYDEIMGPAFRLSVDFIGAALTKWLPRMNRTQRENTANSIFTVLSGLKASGKNENMLKNAYVKFMCWLYYKFERIANALGGENLPKILYEGTVSTYELLLLSVLSQAGCDIVLLQYQGDAEYLKLDPGSKYSKPLHLDGASPFPAGFTLSRLREQRRAAQERERLFGPPPAKRSCTNAWLSGDIFADLRKAPGERGGDGGFFYNCFVRINGVEDRLTYQNELYRLRADLLRRGRKIVVVNGEIPAPSPEEINAVRRQSCQTVSQLVADLSGNLRFAADQELRRLMRRAFAELLLEEGDKAGANLNRLTGKAVTLLCWAGRFYPRLFGNRNGGDIVCFVHFGGCKTDNEALFCRFLARLPVDVLILKPDLGQSCRLSDGLLYERNFPESLPAAAFPEETEAVQTGTSAYHAERDLDSLMYRDSGLYRDRQYEKANILLLRTMYEEIPILWDQELKYRPNFSAEANSVTMPVLFSKISGVKDGDAAAYWGGIKRLLTEDTVLIPSVPHRRPEATNPVKAFAPGFWKNGRLQKNIIRSHKAYPYALLREPMQNYLLDKMQLLIEQRLIRGTFENGTEYAIISVALNLEKNILRLIQKFDFTKKNPKLIYIAAGEAALSLEDAIQAAFLSLVGFDILLFVPTGYQCVERYYTKNVMEEHQAGEYKYDLSVPDFSAISFRGKPTWRSMFFRRGV